MSTVAPITLEQIKTLLDRSNETLLEAVAKMLTERLSSVPTAAAAPSKKERRRKKAAEEGAESAAPKAPSTNPWILFTKRVEGLIRADEETRGVAKEERMKTVVAKQFASDLKGQKGYDGWTDDAILSTLRDWAPPEVSKQAAAGKSKKSASAASSEAGSDDEAAGESAEKPKRKWSEEAKAAAAAKRAAKKAAAAPAAEPAAEAPAAAAEPATKLKKVTIKPKSVAAAPKTLDLRFYAWEHDGQSYFTNERGDVVTTEFEWVGRFDGKTLDKDAPEPTDLENAQMKE